VCAIRLGQMASTASVAPCRDSTLTRQELGGAQTAHKVCQKYSDGGAHLGEFVLGKAANAEGQRLSRAGAEASEIPPYLRNPKLP
jgi:hypothetical protein